MRVREEGGDWVLETDSAEEQTEAVQAQLEVFARALTIYAQRNVKYNDNWKPMGVRGQLIRVRERAERLWDALWEYGGSDVDDALDLINFAGFLVRGAEGETTHGGKWWA